MIVYVSKWFLHKQKQNGLVNLRTRYLSKIRPRFEDVYFLASQNAVAKKHT